MKNLTITCASALLLLSGCARTPVTATNDAAKVWFDAWLQIHEDNWTRTPLGCYITEDAPGTGAGVQEDTTGNRYLWVEYTATTLEGSLNAYSDAASARQMNAYAPYNYYGPRIWQRGENTLYAGVEDALIGMKEGGRRRFVMPGWLGTYLRYKDEAAYLDKATGTAAIYDVKLVKIIPDIVAWETDSLRSYLKAHFPEAGDTPVEDGFCYIRRKAAINDVPSDVHVVILDSCFSGNFIRTKGGQKQKPFLLDDSAVVKGHAYLSSSSSQESSQESDEIGSSFFTNAMLTGLRGAADSSGDKKVTLNELYSYAFNETLSKTENSSAGPQHPNYNITLVGSGDLVLSDISNSDSIVQLSSELKGRIILRDKNGKLISEVNKSESKPIFLALEEGDYTATLITKNMTMQGGFSLKRGGVYTLSTNSLSPVASSFTRTRGDDGSAADAEADFEAVSESGDELFVPVEFSLVNNEIYRQYGKKVVTPLSLGLVRSKVYAVNGAMVSLFINEADIVHGAQVTTLFNTAKEVHGAQASAIYNRAQTFSGFQGAGIFNSANDTKGSQVAGIFNTAHDIKGLQVAGIFNYAQNVENGSVQVGLVNVAKEVQGFQIGLLNLSKNGVVEAGLSYTSNKNLLLAVNSGNKHLYTVVGTARKEKDFLKKDDGTGESRRIVFAGLGSRFNLGIMNFDIEGLGNIISVKKDDAEIEEEKQKAKSSGKKEDEINEHDIYVFPALRLSAGLTPVKHLNIFTGAIFSFELDKNKEAFDNMKSNLSFKSGGVKVHPEFELGVRFSLN